MQFDEKWDHSQLSLDHGIMNMNNNPYMTFKSVKMRFARTPRSNSIPISKILQEKFNCDQI